jgi:hypothetical protein
MFWHGVHVVQSFFQGGPRSANEISGVPASAPPEYVHRAAPAVHPDTIATEPKPEE